MRLAVLPFIAGISYPSSAPPLGHLVGYFQEIILQTVAIFMPNFGRLTCLLLENI